MPQRGLLNDKLIDIIGDFIETWGRRTINLTIVSIPRKQVPLNERFADVHVVAMHAVLCGTGENHTKTDSMWDRAESFLEIASAMFILAMHVLTLDN
jgi:hypothetical protein